MSVSLLTIAGLVATLTRTAHSGRAHFAKAHGLEPGSGFLIGQLMQRGDMRASDLSDLACVDAAVVSRQLKNLLQNQLVERVADPQDGRASLIRLTPKGETLFHENREFQLEFFQEVFRDWENSEVAKFQELFTRFVSDLSREVQSVSHKKEKMDE